MRAQRAELAWPQSAGTQLPIWQGWGRAPHYLGTPWCPPALEGEGLKSPWKELAWKLGVTKQCLAREIAKAVRKWVFQDLLQEVPRPEIIHLGL